MGPSLSSAHVGGANCGKKGGESGTRRGIQVEGGAETLDRYDGCKGTIKHYMVGTDRSILDHSLCTLVDRLQLSKLKVLLSILSSDISCIYLFVVFLCRSCEAVDNICY